MGLGCLPERPAYHRPGPLGTLWISNNTIDKYGWTLLLWDASNGEGVVVKRLLEGADIEPGMRGTNRLAPLLETAWDVH